MHVRRLLALAAIPVVVTSVFLWNGSPAAYASAAPKGAPVVIAMISQESGPSALPDAREAAQAAVKYVNARLGGVKGHPLKFVFCVTDGSPEQSASCANKLLGQNPVAFVGESELGTAGSVPIVAHAGVPFFGDASVTPELVTSPDAFSMGLDAVTDTAGWVKYMATKGHGKRINLINLEIPAASIFQKVVQSVAAANGSSLGTTASLSPTATDATSEMAAASQGSPDGILAITNQQLCVPLMEAHQSLAPTVPLYLPGICGAPQEVRAAGAAADGVHIGFSFFDPVSTANPQVATYRAALAKYGSKNIALSEFASNAFAAVINIRAIIDGLPGPVTASAILTATKAAVNQPGFMGKPWTCNHSVPLDVSACASGIRMLQVKRGHMVDVGGAWFDGSAQIKLS